MKQADKVCLALLRFLFDKRSICVMPNYYIGWYECDVFEMSRAKFTTEYEIKVSKADFKKDFEKQGWSQATKHQKIKNGERTNCFYFVTTPNLVTVEDIPDYAGLIEVDIKSKYPKTKTIKLAPRIHKNKISDKEYGMLIQKINLRYLFNYWIPKFEKLHIQEVFDYEGLQNNRGSIENIKLYEGITI